ncbi:hypothetical protein [Algoriphagus terrigena]|uniref:hypothetical protein n=1 Tax=Algoriphagus terrigena TaxID=344884 RepID=UPI00041435D7|nr:hypothetical protein [Algoriphagus terrigena]
MKNNILLTILGTIGLWEAIPPILIFVLYFLKWGYPYFETTLDFILDWRREENALKKWEGESVNYSKKKRKPPS